MAGFWGDSPSMVLPRVLMNSCRDHNRVNICHLACYGIASAVNVLTRTSECHLSPEPLCTLPSLKGALINSIFVTKY
jgi:hypothetical protein